MRISELDSSKTSGGGTDGTLLIALLPCVVLGVGAAGWSAVWLLACTVAAATLTAWVSSRVGRRPMIPGSVAAGILFALTLPATVPILPAAASMAVGSFLAWEVFGSRARTFVHPAVLAYAFLTLNWPDALGAGSAWMPTDGVADAPWSAWFVASPVAGALGATSTLACVAGGAWLLARRALAWRVVVAVPIGAALAVAILGSAQPTGATPFFGHCLLGSLAFGAIFLATDPQASPRTPSGQWFHGALVGALVPLFRLTIAASPDGTLSALLVASIFAPLVDHVVRVGRARWAETTDG